MPFDLSFFSFLSPLDKLSIIWFLSLAYGYSWWVEHGPRRHKTLSSYMNYQRERWLREALAREIRIVDTAIITGLQNGTAFFASASLLAIGGCFALLRSSKDIIAALKQLPVGINTDLQQIEFKLIGLALIFAYAFFKFGWAFRLLSYNAILIGALPPHDNQKPQEAEQAVQQAFKMSVNAGKHFNKGLRTFFFAISYIGWFIGPAYFMIATCWITLVLYLRQFHSKTLRGL